LSVTPVYFPDDFCVRKQAVGSYRVALFA